MIQPAPPSQSAELSVARPLDLNPSSQGATPLVAQSDTITADSKDLYLRPFCSENAAPSSATERNLCPETVSWSSFPGLHGSPRPLGRGENSWLLSLILLMLVILTFNYNNCRRLIKAFPQDLLSVRRRSNAFDDHTASENRSSLLIVILLCLSEGILMLTAAEYFVHAEVAPDVVFRVTITFSVIALGFYVAQLLIYSLVGYTFTDRIATAQWIRGFNASQQLLAMLLLLPALVSLFYPSSEGWMLWISAIAYVSARLLFISKGFRIFYNNFPSLLYFILYLCALEITPLLIIRRLILQFV